MRLIITGASGFIGQKIVPLLAEKNIDLVLIGRDASALAMQYPNFITGSYAELIEKGKGADALLHLAVLNNDQKGTETDFHDANVALLKSVIDACRAAGIPKFIYTASLHSHNKNTPYSRSKAAADAALLKVDDVQVMQLRLPAVYAQDSFTGKLGILNKVPNFARGFAFQILSSFKPTVHVNKIADEVAKALRSKQSFDKIISDGQKTNSVYHVIKTLSDISFAVFILILFWWLLLLVWALISITSKGPGILAQKRVGKEGRLFTLYKFRTMHHATKHVATHEVAAGNVTKIGHILRRTKIDELPQVFNILKGEMSFVGPRPCLPVQETLIEERRKYSVLNVKPGITGYAQIRNIDMSDPKYLAQTDGRYVDLRSTLLDFRIIIQTAIGAGQGDRTQ